jgi:sugar phosphate isomerase/epimerase
MPLSRRNFLTLTAMTGTKVLFNSLEAFAKPLTGAPADPAYDLLIFATKWGDTRSWNEFASNIKQAGYDGAELWFPSDAAQRLELLSAFKHHGLKIGFLVGARGPDFQKHLNQFTSSLEAAAAQKPVYINCHSGQDYYSFEQNSKFIEATSRVSRTSGVPVYHETHRSRMLYSAPVARQFIETVSDLRITLDISHWCNVHESLLQDQEKTISQTLERVDHIHARIGHAEGPQVNDPRAPEWKDAVEAHFAWWDSVVSRKKKDGKLLTFLTEFGPVDYMPALPYTRQPIADQWAINKHILDILRTRYS